MSSVPNLFTTCLSHKKLVLVCAGSLGFLLPFEYDEIYENTEGILTEDVRITLRMVSRGDLASQPGGQGARGHWLGGMR